MLKGTYPKAKPPRVEVEIIDALSAVAITAVEFEGRVVNAPAVAKQIRSVFMDGKWASVTVWECGCEDIIEEEGGERYITFRTPCCKEHEI